jgi:hypothetical protein
LAWIVSRRAWRIILGIAVCLLAVGLVVDAAIGLPVLRGAQSPKALLSGLLALGGFFFFAESAFAYITSADKVTNPLWKRLLHVVAQLCLWAVVLVGVWLISRLFLHERTFGS